MSDRRGLIIFFSMTKSATQATAIFQEKLLEGRRARLAYPLVRLLNPSITLDEWIAFARRWSRLSPQQGGIMTIIDGRDYLHAIFTYRVEHNLRLGCFVRIADVIMGHLPGDTLNRTILECADRLAEQMGCGTVVIEPAQDQPAGRLLAESETTPFGFLRGRERIRPISRH